MSTNMNLMAASANGSQVVRTSQQADSVKSSARTAASKGDSTESKPFSSMLDKATDRSTGADTQEAQKTTDTKADQSQTAAETAKTEQNPSETVQKTPEKEQPVAEHDPGSQTDGKEEKQGTANLIGNAMNGLFNLSLGIVTPAVQPTEVQTAGMETEKPVVNPQLSNAQIINTKQNNALETLLPQAKDQKQTVQNQQLLAMLSSTGTKATMSSPDMQRNEIVQIMNPKLQAATVENVNLAGNLAGSAQAAASFKTDADVQTSTATELATAGGNTTSSLLSGVKLTVENQMQNQNNQMQQQGSQQNAQLLEPGMQQQSSQQDAQSPEPGMQQQLPEEARFDTAPLKSTVDASGGSTQVNMFQQQTSQVQDMATVKDKSATSNAQAPDFDVPKQIVEQAKLIRSTEDTQMVIKLKPEHLGELTLKVSVSANGSVNASFHTDNAQVKAILENTMVQLRQDLQAQGLKVDNVGVYAGLSDNSLLNSQQQSQNFQQQNGSARSQKIDLAAFEEEDDALRAVQSNEMSTEDGIDYRI